MSDHPRLPQADQLEYDFDYHPYRWQFEFQKGLHGKNHGVAICARQHGKTVAAIHELLLRALAGPPNTAYAYVAPYISQARRVGWEVLLKACAGMLKAKHAKVRKDDLYVELTGGRRIWMMGTDNENCRGMSIRGAIIDEFDSVDMDVYRQAFLPTLSAYKDHFLIYIGTLKSGESRLNELYETYKNNPEWHCVRVPASKAGVMSKKRLLEWETMLGELNYAREFECSPNVGSEHAVIADLIIKAEKEDRVLSLPKNPIADMQAVFDIGVRDATAVWIFQLVGQFIHFHAYYEYNDMGLIEVIQHIQSKHPTARWGETLFPWDIMSREASTGRSIMDSVYDLRFGDPIALKRFNIADSINAARLNTSRCRFDEDGCQLGLRRLKAVSYAYDPKTEVAKDKVLHDKNSHCFDAYRYVLAHIEVETPYADAVDFRRQAQLRMTRTVKRSC